MKAIKLVSALAFGLGLIVAMPGYAQHVNESHAEHADAVPVPAQRYAPDASLKKGMRRARVAVEDLRQHEMGHMSEAIVADRASTVQEAVNTMFANCKLAPEPDAALHSILLPVLNAALELQAHPGDAKPVAEMRAELAHYPQYFDDPGWGQPAPAEPDAHGHS